jgi:hypothetical protein
MRTAAVVVLISLLAAGPVAADEGELDTARFHPPAGYFTGPELDYWTTGLLLDDLTVTRPAILAGSGDDDWAAFAYSHPPDFPLTWQVVTRTGQLPPCSVTFPGASFFPADVGLDRSDRLVVTGSVYYSGSGFLGFVARFLMPSCTFDASFDGDGYFTFDDADDVLLRRLGFVELGNFPFTTEKIVLAGALSGSGPSPVDALLLRLDPDGSLDDDFGGGDGVVIADWAGENNHLVDLRIDPEDRILVAGAVGPDGGGIAWDAMVARFEPDGDVDPTFGIGGWRRFHQGTTAGADSVAALLQAGNGDLHLVGESRPPSGTDRIVVTRLDASLTSETFPLGGSSTVDGAGIEGDRRLVLYGRTDRLGGGDRLYTMARRLPGLELDPEYNDLSDFDALTYVTVGPPGLEDLRAAPGLRVSTTGWPMVAALAGSDSIGEAAPLLLRLTSSLLFADGFETGSTANWP